MDFAAKGAAALAAKDHPAALTLYTKALIDHPSSPDYFTQRSIAFTRLSPPRHDLALQDAEYAVLLGQKRAKREKIQAGQQRRVVALHGLGRYADAKAVLETTVKWRPENSKPAKMEGDMWMAKIENKLKSVPDNEKVATEKEYPTVDLPSETKMTEWLRSQLKTDGSFKFDGDTDMKTEETTSSTVPSTQDSKATDQATTTQAVAPPTSAKIRHEWYQSSQSVTITIYAKGVSKTSCEIDIQEDSVYISFPHPADPSSTYSFTLDPLYGLIDPSQSKASVLSTKVELTLRKARQGQKWPGLEDTAPLNKDTKSDPSTSQLPVDDAAKTAVLSTLSNNANNTTSSQPVQPKESGPSYPTSSRSGPKNWDKLANDLTAKPKPKSKTKSSSDSKQKANDDDQKESADSEVEDAGYDSDLGGDEVDGFFKKLYKGADDDTRRAMMKSFYESNGTALSTNWKDVGAKKVEEVKSKDD